MPFRIIRNDITKVEADVIVNTANPYPVIGNGTDSAIYAAAGEKELLAERLKIGEIAPGQAAATPAFGLRAKYIIHTVGPAWVDGKHGEREILCSCYEKSLRLAADLQAESIAFPLISTGVYGFPKGEAINLAMGEIGKFLLTADMNVLLVVFDRESVALSRQMMKEIDEFIDEYGVGLAREAEYGSFTPGDGFLSDARAERRRRQERLQESRRIAREDRREEAQEASPFEPFGLAGEKDLEEVIGKAGDTFQERLFRLIDESGMDDVKVYGDAMIGRKVFSSIRCNRKYKPSKRTAICLAVALHLDLPAAMDLLGRAGYAFSPSNETDLIVLYFVKHRIYDLFRINEALEEHGQEPLGSVVA